MAATNSGTKSFPIWLILLLLFILLSGVIYAVPKFSGIKPDLAEKALLHEVATDDLLITVTEEGNVESASNVDIKCQVAGGTSILWIVEDGKQVEEGEKLVEFDSSALEEQINTQRIAFEKARATKIQSEKNVSVAKISLTEYIEGTFKQLTQDAEAVIKISEENLRSSKNSLEHSERMFRKGYVSELDLEAARFSVERANLELGSAETALEVLVKFTKEKTLEDLKSQVDNAEAQMRSDGSAFELEESRLKRLEDQMANCTILAPADGMVVYANERGGRFGQSTATIEEGVAVRERQTILRLPDLDQMQVKVNVHESKVDQIQPEMRARVRILNKEVTGYVTTIANQPEPTSFFSGNVKEYATSVRIDKEAARAVALRPGMTAEVEILVAHLKEVPTVPVAAVVEQRGKFFAWAKADGEPEKRPLVLGLTNDQFVEIQDGLAVGDSVLLNPRAMIKEARELGEEEEVDVSKKFGDAKPAAGGRPSGGQSSPNAGGGGRPGADGGRPNGSPSGGASSDGPPARRSAGSGGGMGSLDKDGDGKISLDEAPGGMKDHFSKMDGNGDGFIDKAEMAKLRSGGGGRSGGAGGGGPPAGAGR